MLAVLILAGGEAKRLPRKLEREFRGEPLILRVYRNVRSAGSVYVSANRTFPRAIDAALECPQLVDRTPGLGPLSALHSALGQIAEERVFVVSGDLPFANAALCGELLAQWDKEEIDGVVPLDAAGEVQPLCAVYDRARFVSAIGEALAVGSASVKSAMVRLRMKRVRVSDARLLAGVNTPEELVAVRTFDIGLHPRT